YLASTATAYYWRDLGFALRGLRLAAGLGYQKTIEAQRRDPAEFPASDPNLVFDSVRTVSDHSVLDLYARLSYDHMGKTTYGVAMQYFNGSLMGEVYLHIFAWMRAEVKYSRVVFRDIERWE